jgi:antibiotic biosynthesis monooxygenase (ABM) superfamily enzyme
MICRIWHGWTTPENADAYEHIVRTEVIPRIEERRIPGFRHIDLMRRELDGEVEFLTAMWFDDVESIKAFVGEDHTVSHVPAAARAVLARFDERSSHYDVLEDRPQPPV